MDVFTSDSVKGIYDELFKKHPSIRAVVERRASMKGLEGDEIYKWLVSLGGDEWDELLQEIEMVTRKSLMKIVRSSLQYSLS